MGLSEFVASLVYAKMSKPELHIETLSPTKTNQDKTKQKANHNQTFNLPLSAKN